jgi:hypothetical protein
MANTVIYIIYLIISLFITWKVGNHLHKHGRSWVIYTLKDEILADKVNDLLLLLYRLFNGGYLVYTMMAFPEPDGLISIIHFFTDRFGLLLLMLAFLHYQNIVALIVFSSSFKIYQK